MQRRAWLIFAAILTCSVGIALFSLLLPVLGDENPAQVHSRTAIAAVIASMSIGAGIWFLTGLSHFKIGLRVAYRLLAVGVILFGLSLLQLPIAGLFDLWNSAWTNSGAIIVPFMAASVMIYAGLRRFAHLLQLATKLTSFVGVTFVAAAFAAGSTAAASRFMPYELEGITVYVGTVGWTLVYLCCSAILASRIRYVIGREYQKAMAWLAVTLAAFTIGALHEYIFTFFFNVDTHPYPQYGFSIWPTGVASLLLVMASRQFYLLGASADTPARTSESQPSQAIHDSDYVDSIVAIANLASRPQDIDPFLDNLRLITAREASETAFSEAEKAQLLATYKSIEEYLVQEEPLRTFTKEEIRQRVTPAFRNNLEALAE